MQVAALPIPFHRAANNRPPPRHPRRIPRLRPDATATPTPVMPPPAPPATPTMPGSSQCPAPSRLRGPLASGNLPNRPAREGGILPLPPNERLALDIPARGA